MKEKLPIKFSNEIAYLRTILLNTPGCIYWKDLSGVYMGCNRVFLDMVGFNNESEVIGKTDKDFCWKNQANDLRKHDRSVIESREAQILEEEVDLADGNKKLYSVVKRPLYDEEGDIIGIVGTSVDISYRKEIEDNLKAAKVQAEAASRSKSELMANVSHDFRNLLASMDGMIGKMAWDIEEKERSMTTASALATDIGLKDFIQTLQHDNQQLMEATQEFLQLCENILEAMRLESGQLAHRIEVFDLEVLLKHTVNLLRLMAQDKGLSLSYHLDANVPRCLSGKRLALDHILLNLVGNALKFTKQGFVRITVTLAEPQASLSCKPGDCIEIKIAVEDSGIGIPADKQEQIFDRFERLTPAYEGVYKGSGLGLYAVKQYVESLQGRIQVASEIGQGSCFTVTVPFTVADPGDIESSKMSKGEANAHGQSQTQTTKAPSAKKSLISLRQDSGQQAATRDTQAVADLSAEALAKAEASAKTDSARATVLVVEDNAMAAIGIQTKLKQLYCAVELAKNGTQAIQMAESKRYDFILMDIGLPDKNGIEVTQTIRNDIDTKVPIIALTGHASDPTWRKACLEAGMQAVLSKPAKLPELESVLKTVVLSGKGGTLSSQAPSVADTPGQLEVIDWAACVRLCQGDESVVREMLSVLAQDLKDTKSVLAKAYAARNMSALRDELHRIRGGICYLKLPELECCLKAFHEEVKADPQDATRLESTYAALQPAMENFWGTWEQY